MSAAGLTSSTTGNLTEDLTRIKVLCIDDQQANLIALDAALAGLECELVHAESGKAAIEAVKNEVFALILLDVQMPIMDGFETAKQIYKIPKAKPTSIIFMTANFPSESYALQGYEAGAVDYLYKPLNVDVLRAKVSIFVELFKKNIEIKKQAELLREADKREQQRQIAELKRVSEKRYQSLVEGIREGIVWTADTETLRIIYVSPHAEKISGYPVEAWLAETSFWEKYILKEDVEKVSAVFQRAIKNEDRAGVEHRFIKPGGGYIWFYTEIHLDSDPVEGNRPLLQGLSVDITHLKKTETALRESIHFRDEFLSIAAHELRTPITPLQLQMQSFIRLIQTNRLRDTAPDILQTMLEISDAQVGRLSRLIDQLLDISRLQEGRLKLTVQRTHLSDLIKGVIDQLKYLFDGSECKVTLDLEDGVYGDWDPLRIEQVVINLLTNSVKYGPREPILIRLAAKNGNAIITVKDRGIGIAKKDFERIFKRFERAISAEHYGGLGLGLYISEQIISLHKGSIHVESQLGQGSVFEVRLPQRAEFAK